MNTNLRTAQRLDLKAAQGLLRKLEDLRVLFFIDLNSLSWQPQAEVEPYLRLVIDLVEVNASLILIAQQRLARLAEEVGRVHPANAPSSADPTLFQRSAERN